MIKIVANNYVKKENVEEFLKLASKLIEDSRKEEGCIIYTLFEDIMDQCHLTFIEEWKDTAAIESHNTSAHFLEIAPKLGKLCSKPGLVEKYKEVEK